MSASSQATKRRNTENKQSRAGERKNTESQLWGAPGPSVYKSDVVAKQKYAVRRLAKKSKVKCPCVLLVGLCVCVF